MDSEKIRPFIQKQLELLRIDRVEIERIRRIYPVVDQSLESIASDFYLHMRTTPEGMRYFAEDAAVDALVLKQLAHWRRLFSARFDEEFAATAVRIGVAHVRHKVPPSLYIAGYNFFQCALIRVVCRRFANNSELPRLIGAICKLVNLDMNLAISVYMKQAWSLAASNEIRL